jgi:hypothetical protein
MRLCRLPAGLRTILLPGAPIDVPAGKPALHHVAVVEEMREPLACWRNRAAARLRLCRHDHRGDRRNTQQQCPHLSALCPPD